MKVNGDVKINKFHIQIVIKPNFRAGCGFKRFQGQGEKEKNNKNLDFKLIPF